MSEDFVLQPSRRATRLSPNILVVLILGFRNFFSGRMLRSVFSGSLAMLAVAMPSSTQRGLQMMRSSSSQLSDLQLYPTGKSSCFNIRVIRSMQQDGPLWLLMKRARYGMRPTIMECQSLTLIMRLRTGRFMKHILTAIGGPITQRAETKSLVI